MFHEDNVTRIVKLLRNPRRDGQGLDGYVYLVAFSVFSS